jgi:hypothetical protein
MDITLCDGWTSIVLHVGIGPFSRKLMKKACPSHRKKLWEEATALFTAGAAASDLLSRGER